MAVAQEELAPDYYGPFLEQEQILYRPTPELKIATVLTLGDFALRVDARPPIVLRDNERFILNFLLSRQVGEALNAQLLTAGFHSEQNIEGAEPVALSNNTASLMRKVNFRFGQVVDKRRVEGSVKIKILLMRDLEINRVSDDDTLGQKHIDIPERPHLHVAVPVPNKRSIPRIKNTPSTDKQPKAVKKPSKPTVTPKQPTKIPKTQTSIEPKPVVSPRPPALSVSDQNFKPRNEKHVLTEAEIISKRLSQYIESGKGGLPVAHDYGQLLLLKRQHRQLFDNVRTTEQQERFAELSRQFADDEERLTGGFAYRKRRGYNGI